MEFSILGPLEVRADGQVLTLGGAKPRALLAVLLLHANEAVSFERLAVALWGEDAPAGAVKTVQVHAARLRRALGQPDVLSTTPAGYRLLVQPDELDAKRFERLVGGGRDALAAGEAERAAALLREAIGLWRGPPLAEFGALPFAAAEIARLEEQRLAAVELRVQADLEAGRQAELVPELQQLTQEHPWRERLHAQLLLALYRSGRQADALAAYQRARETLVEELGIEPGPELAELQQAILGHDASLGPLPPRREARRDGALPAPPNRTIGRDDDVTAVTARLRSSTVRLLTLTGPGGVGKTRLAIEVGHAVDGDFGDGAWFVPLAALRRAGDVPMSIVRALGVVLLEGESPEEAVKRFLGTRRVLLILDNCEHLLGAAPFIGELLERCPAVSVLATSREPLMLRAEERHAVPPLALAGEATRSGDDASALFAERARAQDAEFELAGPNGPAVAEICRRVDGLPLAIELAAAGCALLSPVEIAQRLDGALGALGAAPRDAPARQQTLRATIDWSYELLDDDERAGFARFAVFAGGATVDAAEAITETGLGTLDRLVAKSLLVRRRQPDATTRLTMLETIRAYAGERFAAARDAEAVRERHHGYYLALAERHGTDRALWGRDREQHLASLDADLENVHAALAWAVGRADGRRALALCAALSVYWIMRNRYADAVRWIDAALDVAGPTADPAPRVRALCARCRALFPLGRGEEESSVLRQAEQLAREVDDPVLLSEVLQVRSAHELGEERLADADELAEEALRWARVAGDDWLLAMAAHAKAMASASPTLLRDRVDSAVALLERVGNVYLAADLLVGAAYGALCHGSDVDAAQFVARATPGARDLGIPYLWMLLRGNGGLAALFTGDADAARDGFREELELCRKLAVLPFAGEGLAGLAAVAIAGGELERAAWLCGAMASHRYGEPHDPVHERLRATFFDPGRERFGAEAWDAVVRRGAAASFDEAIAAALEEQPIPRVVEIG